ncbi:MAG: hypothetical protein ACYTG0_41070, partial [Planctomycetota bacterium]
WELIDGLGINDEYAAWSPDGTTLAFISDRDGTSEIYIGPLAADAVDPDSIMRLTDSKKLREYWLAWSPDGEQIAYHSTGRGGPRERIGKVIVATGEQFQLIDSWTDSANPDWSP